MKKRPLHFLGRKDNSLFDTNVKMKDMEDVELVLGSSAILESGTASVRARPTVKHHSSTYDSFHGFAVPTPTVPLYTPAVNGTKINGSVSDDQSSNGSTVSISDPVEGEIFVPAPPSSAPPPPPELFILPPPEFMGDLSNLQPPPMTAPKPTKPFVSLQEEDLSFLNPPLMSPPKPPSTGSNESISGPLSPPVPEHPKFAPPQPPMEKTQKTYKSPPPKPIRISSVASLDSPPDTPAPPPPAHTPTLSTFNPQSPAKIYSAAKTTFLKDENKTQGAKGANRSSILLLEDSGAAPVVVQKDSKIPAKSLPTPTPTPTPAPKVIEKVKSIEPVVPKDVKVVTDIYATVCKDKKPSESQEIKTAPIISAPPPPSPPPPPPPAPQPTKPSPERKVITAATLKDISKSPKSQRVSGTQDTTKLDKPEGSPALSSKYSPLLDHKLNHLKTKEPTSPKDSSPLALLKAAKEREKQRSGSVNENSVRNEQPSDLKLDQPVNLSLQQESPKIETAVAPSKQLNLPLPSAISSSTVQVSSPSVPKPAPSQLDVQKVDLNAPKQQVNSQVPWTSQTPSKTLPATSPNVNLVLPSPSPSKTLQVPSVTNLAPVQVNKAEWNVPKQVPVNSPSTSLTPSKTVQAAIPSVTKPVLSPVQVEDSKVDLNVSFLPPPPEFGDFGDEEEEPPPTMVPPDPPQKNIPPPHSPPPIPPPPPPSNVTPPPPAPQLPPISNTTIKPIKSKPPPVLAKPKHSTKSATLPAPASASQATLLNILKKKMLEMDQKMGPMNEPEPSSDDWGLPLPDEDNKVPVFPKFVAPKNTDINKSATLNMKELESKIASKSSSKMPTIPTSHGPSRHQYGMTFKVRPGTKQPITLVSRGEL